MIANGEWIERWLLAFARSAPIVSMHPVFGGRTLPRPVLVGTAAALSLATLARAPISSPTPLDFIAELVYGIAIGLLGRAVFGAIEAAGRFVDDVRGANVAQMYSPQLETAASPLAHLELVTSLAVYWGLGLHVTFVAIAFERAPSIGALPPLDDVTGVAAVLSRSALSIAGPAAACCVLVDVLMGFVGRASPTTNVFMMSQPVKLTVALLVTALGAHGRVRLWAELWSSEHHWIERLLSR